MTDPTPDPKFDAAASADAPDSQPEPFVLSYPDDPASLRDWGLWAGVLALLVLVSFWPSVNGKFLFDDDRFVQHNDMTLHRGDLLHIWIPSKLQTIQYYPLTFTSFWIEQHLWGRDTPLGFRLVNLVLQAGAAIVLWRALRRLGLPAPWLIAAIWAIHPLQAESVAWISQRRNLLGGLLAVSSLLFYLDAAGVPDPDFKEPLWNLPERWQTHLIAFLFALAAFTANSVVWTLPIVIFIVLWWKRRLNRSLILSLIPLLIIGIIFALITRHIETNPNGSIQASGPDWQIPWLQRFLIAGRGFWFYPRKLLFPHHLSFNYPRILPNPRSAQSWIPLIGGLILLDMLFMFRKLIGRGPLAAVLCYLTLLFPAIGLLMLYPFRFSFVADHFQYLAGIPLIALGIGIVAKMLRLKPQHRALLAGILVFVLAGVSLNRSYAFFDPPSLWADTLTRNPNSWLAGYNLARDQVNEASDLINQAQSLQSTSEPGLAQSAAANALDDLEDAEDLLQQVIGNEKTPADYNFLSYNELAEVQIIRSRWASSDKGQLFAAAEDYLNKALAGEAPQHATNPVARIYYNMGLVKLDQGLRLYDSNRPPEPTQAQIAAARAHPPTTRPATGIESQMMDLFAQAHDFLQEAIDSAHAVARRPTMRFEAEHILRVATFQLGNSDFFCRQIAGERHDIDMSEKFTRMAIDEYITALHLDETNVEAYYRLAICLEQFGRIDEAKSALFGAMAFAPHAQFAPAYNEYGLILCQNKPTVGNVRKAIECFKAAVGIDPNYAEAKENLKMAQVMLASAPSVQHAATQPATQP
jgi:tetratricopeptide (TPR) repeat protein